MYCSVRLRRLLSAYGKKSYSMPGVARPTSVEFENEDPTTDDVRPSDHFGPRLLTISEFTLQSLSRLRTVSVSSMSNRLLLTLRNADRRIFHCSVTRLALPFT